MLVLWVVISVYPTNSLASPRSALTRNVGHRYVLKNTLGFGHAGLWVIQTGADSIPAAIGIVGAHRRGAVISRQRVEGTCQAPHHLPDASRGTRLEVGTSYPWSGVPTPHEVEWTTDAVPTISFDLGGDRLPHPPGGILCDRRLPHGLLEPW